MVQEFWRKLSANERLVAWGAIALVVVSLLGSGWLSLIGAAAVLVIYWLKYSPSQKVAWPLPVPTIVLAISGILALSAALGALAVLGFAGLGFGVGYDFGLGLFGGLFVLYVLIAIIALVAAGTMLLSAWREYKAASAPRA